MSYGQRSTRQQAPLSHDELEHAADRSSLLDTDAEVCRAFDMVWPGTPKPSRLSCTTFRAGDVVAGRYVIEKFLARGGMGEVYAAHDQRLDMRIALKTLLSVVADDMLCVRRLRRELRLGRRIAHPNVCHAFEIGVHADDPRDIVHFITLELICGESLAARLKRQAIDLREALQITEQLLLGLDAVHGAGVLHRDVKSHNVLLEERGATTRAVLADFGLARRLDARQRLRARRARAAWHTWPLSRSPAKSFLHRPTSSPLA